MSSLVTVRTLDYTVNVNVEKKLPATMVTVGADTTSPRLREIGELARSGMEAAGFDWPRARINIHAEPFTRTAARTAGGPANGFGTRPPRAPAGAERQIPLAAALGVLVLDGVLDESVLDRVLAHADLSLNGELHPLRRSFRAAEGPMPVSAILGAGDNTERVLDYLSTTRTIYAAATLKHLVADLKDEELYHGRRKGELAWPSWPAREARRFFPLGSTLIIVGDAGPIARVEVGLRRILDGLDVYSTAGRDSTEPLELIRALDDTTMPLPEPALLQRPLRLPHHTIGREALHGEAKLSVGGVLYLENAHLLAPGVRSDLKARHLPMAESRVLVAHVDTWEQANALRAYLPNNTIMLPVGAL